MGSRACLLIRTSAIKVLKIEMEGSSHESSHLAAFQRHRHLADRDHCFGRDHRIDSLAARHSHGRRWPRRRASRAAARRWWARWCIRRLQYYAIAPAAAANLVPAQWDRLPGAGDCTVPAAAAPVSADCALALDYLYGCDGDYVFRD